MSMKELLAKHFPPLTETAEDGLTRVTSEYSDVGKEILRASLLECNHQAHKTELENKQMLEELSEQAVSSGVKMYKTASQSLLSARGDDCIVDADVVTTHRDSVDASMTVFDAHLGVASDEDKAPMFRSKLLSELEVALRQ